MQHIISAGCNAIPRTAGADSSVGGLLASILLTNMMAFRRTGSLKTISIAWNYLACKSIQHYTHQNKSISYCDRVLGQNVPGQNVPGKMSRSECPWSECPRSKYPQSKCPQSKCPWSECPQSKCPQSKCPGRNVPVKMSRSKCPSQNVPVNMSRSKCPGQNVHVKNYIAWVINLLSCGSLFLIYRHIYRVHWHMGLKPGRWRR